jgi:L-2-hydroxyglutarate oxidase LhgO
MTLETTEGEISAKLVRGLQSDRISRIANAKLDSKIVSFRGEYYDLVPSRTDYLRGLNMAAKYWQTSLGEYYRSWRKAAFVRALQRLMPTIRAEDLLPGGAGVRAQGIE